MTKRFLTAAGAILAAIIALLMLIALSAETRKQCVVPILMYHDVGETANSPWCVPIETFRSQMTSLREQGFKTILPADISAHFPRRPDADPSGQATTWRFWPTWGWGQPLPRKPVIITFDDGYLSTLTIIEPILKKNGLRAVIYLITGQVAETAADRREYEGKKCLVWSEVLAMQKRRIFAFGGHSHSHGNLAASGDPLSDILECRRQLKIHGIREPYSFCYPYGQQQESTQKAAKQAEFRTAVVCEDAVASIGPTTNLFALPRVSVMGGSHEFKLLNKEADVNEKTLIYRVLHTGIPLEISACLRGNGKKKNEKDIWLPSREVSQGEFELQFMLPDADTANTQKKLEIWDKHRLFKLATLNQ